MISEYLMSFKNIRCFLIFIIYFSLVESKKNIQEVPLKNLETNIYDLTETSFFHVIPNFDNNIPNYLKIEISIKDSFHANNEDIILSYYQRDCTFEIRIQLSLNGSVIWLTKNQIEKDFYFSVELLYSEITYDIYINPKDVIILELNEQYTYYVTEENKEMEFRICGDIGWGTEGKNGLLSIWAKGDKDIKTEINEKNNYKHPKYNAYLIKINDTIYYEYILEVKGTPGDIINVGHQFFYSDTNTSEISFGTEYFGILKKNLAEKICYYADFSSHTFYSFIHDTQEFNIVNYEYEDYMGNKKYCLYLNNTELEEYFYSVQAIKNSDSYENGIITPLQKLGINYERKIKEGKIIAIIPNNYNDDYNYINYHIQEKRGLIKAAIYSCYTYPNCKIGSLSNEILLKNYNSYSFSFTKTEYGNITSFTHQQNILFISCEEGTYQDEEKICSINVNIYTDKNKISILPQAPFYNYIREKNEDNLLINHPDLVNIVNNYNKINIYLNIELLSGDAIFSFNSMESYKYKNKILYEFLFDNNIEYILNIKAKANSVYSVIVTFKDPDDENIHLATNNINYLLKFDNNLNYHYIKFSKNENQYNSTDIEPLYYLSFYPLNCNINVQNKTNNNLKLKNGFYQDIIRNNEGLIYNISKDISEPNNCMFLISAFIFEDDNNVGYGYINGITLSSNNSHSFLFDKTNNMLQFLYPHSEKDKDLNINFKLLDNENYDIALFFNDVESEIKYFITKSESFIIKSSYLTYNCMSYNQVCKINFIIKSQNKLDESVIEILISNYDSNSSNDSDASNNTDSNNSGNNILLISIIIICIIFILIAIVLAIILIFKCKNKNKYFKEEIDNLTYLNDKKNNNEE